LMVIALSLVGFSSLALGENTGLTPYHTCTSAPALPGCCCC
jgi:hypothetical protein